MPESKANISCFYEGEYEANLGVTYEHTIEFLEREVADAYKLIRWFAADSLGYQIEAMTGGLSLSNTDIQTIWVEELSNGKNIIVNEGNDADVNMDTLYRAFAVVPPPPPIDEV